MYIYLLMCGNSVCFLFNLPISTSGKTCDICLPTRSLLLLSMLLYCYMSKATSACSTRLDYFSITLTKCLIYHSLHCHASIQYHRHCHTSGNWSAVVLTSSFWLANEPRAIIQLLSLLMRIGIRQRLMLNEFLIRWMQELAVLINNLNNSQWQQQQPKPSQQ